ncbi:hypothetical protein BJ508DRAFT_351427 [Ascobolus immersus RN42]|uniref:Uncharacterized protein n=1 Tax=Ascobolus immersus RN42 TaxID=1160509 RepID=A0A3N4HS73_ASCIM|nr:hypothetical protein BJ508DRAFT_351427 [Ascobolus immersus RN42]
MSTTSAVPIPTAEYPPTSVSTVDPLGTISSSTPTLTDYRLGLPSHHSSVSSLEIPVPTHFTAIPRSFNESTSQSGNDIDTVLDLAIDEPPKTALQIWLTYTWPQHQNTISRPRDPPFTPADLDHIEFLRSMQEDYLSHFDPYTHYVLNISPEGPFRLDLHANEDPSDSVQEFLNGLKSLRLDDESIHQGLVERTREWALARQEQQKLEAKRQPDLDDSLPHFREPPLDLLQFDNNEPPTPFPEWGYGTMPLLRYHQHFRYMESLPLTHMDLAHINFLCTMQIDLFFFRSVEEGGNPDPEDGVKKFLDQLAELYRDDNGDTVDGLEARHEAIISASEKWAIGRRPEWQDQELQKELLAFRPWHDAKWYPRRHEDALSSLDSTYDDYFPTKPKHSQVVGFVDPWWDDDFMLERSPPLNPFQEWCKKLWLSIQPQLERIGALLTPVDIDHILFLAETHKGLLFRYKMLFTNTTDGIKEFLEDMADLYAEKLRDGTVWDGFEERHQEILRDSREEAFEIKKLYERQMKGLMRQEGDSGEHLPEIQAEKYGVSTDSDSKSEFDSDEDIDEEDSDDYIDPRFSYDALTGSFSPRSCNCPSLQRVLYVNGEPDQLVEVECAHNTYQHSLETTEEPSHGVLIERTWLMHPVSEESQKEIERRSETSADSGQDFDPFRPQTPSLHKSHTHNSSTLEDSALDLNTAFQPTTVQKSTAERLEEYASETWPYYQDYFSRLPIPPDDADREHLEFLRQMDEDYIRHDNNRPPVIEPEPLSFSLLIDPLYESLSFFLLMLQGLNDTKEEEREGRHQAILLVSTHMVLERQRRQRDPETFLRELKESREQAMREHDDRIGYDIGDASLIDLRDSYFKLENTMASSDESDHTRGDAETGVVKKRWLDLSGSLIDGTTTCIDWDECLRDLRESSPETEEQLIHTLRKEKARSLEETRAREALLNGLTPVYVPHDELSEYEQALSVVDYPLEHPDTCPGSYRPGARSLHLLPRQLWYVNNWLSKQAQPPKFRLEADDVTYISQLETLQHHNSEHWHLYSVKEFLDELLELYTNSNGKTDWEEKHRAFLRASMERALMRWEQEVSAEEDS